MKGINPWLVCLGFALVLVIIADLNMNFMTWNESSLWSKFDLRALHGKDEQTSQFP